MLSYKKETWVCAFGIKQMKNLDNPIKILCFKFQLLKFEQNSCSVKTSHQMLTFKVGVSFANLE